MPLQKKCSCYSQRQNLWLEPSILLLLLDNPCHGYEIIAMLPDFGFSQNSIDPGAVYRTLRHMEENEFVNSAWDVTGSGPAKRQYTITEKGREHLLLWTDMLKGRRQAIDSFLVRVKKNFTKKVDQHPDIGKNT